MKVLLFVQTGDARPKVEYRLPAKLAWDVFARWLSERPVNSRATDAQAIALIMAWRADRWLLVECENARNGREAIAMAMPVKPGASPVASWPRGNILASGGKQAVKP